MASKFTIETIKEDIRYFKEKLNTEENPKNIMRYEEQIQILEDTLLAYHRAVRAIETKLRNPDAE